MGVWGTKLFSSDLALDIRDHYRELIEDGMGDAEAARQTIGKYEGLFDDPEDGVTALLAYAVTQSKIGRLDPEIRDRAVTVIDQGGDLSIWEREEPKLVPKRKAELAKIRAQLTGAQPSRKRLKPPKLIKCGLSAGDVLAFALPNGHVLVRVVRVQSNRKFEEPVLEELEYKGATLPSAEVLESLPPRELSLAFQSVEHTWFGMLPRSNWANVGFVRIGKTGYRPVDSHPRQPAHGMSSWDALADRYRSFRADAESPGVHHEPAAPFREVQQALARKNRREVFDQIKNNPRVLELAQSPELLDLIVQYDRPLDSSTKAADLYERHIAKMLANEHFKFAEQIAWQMQNSGPMPVAELEKRLQHFEIPSDLFRDLLVRQASDFTFGHPSCREYLVARKVIQLLQQGTFIECKLSDSIIQFIREMWRWNPPEIRESGDQSEAMVWIPAGPFIYGAADTARMAEIKTGFWIDQYPVTNQQYLTFLTKVGKTNIDKRWIGFNHQRSRITGNLTLTDPKYADHPVSEVSWYGAQAYAEAEPGRRLPTEEEWEKAARGMDGRAYPWGDEFDDRYANTESSCIYDTTAVNKYPRGRSSYGAFDMAGNVCEWTNSGEGSFKILRGGPWSYAPTEARCTVRSRGGPDQGDYRFGFRCARTKSHQPPSGRFAPRKGPNQQRHFQAPACSTARMFSRHCRCGTRAFVATAPGL